jgi:hypothetical protein
MPVTRQQYRRHPMIVENIQHLSELGSPRGRYLATIAIVDALATTSIASPTWYTRDSIARRIHRSIVSE